MATRFDIRDWYNLPELSNLTIKTGPPEITCHKVILATRSPYFRTAFKETNGFTESQQEVLTLEGDTPAAVEAVVRHIYGFGYEEILAAYGGGRVTPWVHLANYAAADKYLLPELAALAVDGLQSVLLRVGTGGTVGEADRYTVEEVFELVKALRGRDAGDHGFTEMGMRFMEQHLGALHRVKEFQGWLEEEGNQDALERVNGVIVRGADVVDLVGPRRVVQAPTAGVGHVGACACHGRTVWCAVKTPTRRETDE